MLAVLGMFPVAMALINAFNTVISVPAPTIGETEVTVLWIEAGPSWANCELR